MKKLTFPPIEILQQKTRSIINDDQGDSIAPKLSEIFSCYKTINFDLGYEWPIWRVRACNSPQGFNNLQELSHPAPEITPIGRLNHKTQPLLYASLNKFTALTEVGATNGDYLHIIGYGLRRETKLKCAIVGEVFNVHRSGRSRTSEALTKELNRLLNASDFRAARSWVFLDAFLASLLSDKNAASNDYIHSRAVADQIFSQVSDIDAIYYPSVALENGINLAIKPESASKLLEVRGTTVIRITRLFDYGIYDFEVIRNSSGFYPDGKIRW